MSQKGNSGLVIMKKIVVLMFICVSLLTVSGCQKKNNNSNIREIDGYSNYYLVQEEGEFAVLNYDERDLSNLPSYQEVIEYIKDEKEGNYYLINICDTSNLDKFYEAKIHEGTHELLSETNDFFTSDEEKTETVKKLIKIMESVQNNEN